MRHHVRERLEPLAGNQRRAQARSAQSAAPSATMIPTRAAKRPLAPATNRAASGKAFPNAIGTVWCHTPHFDDVRLERGEAQRRVETCRRPAGMHHHVGVLAACSGAQTTPQALSQRAPSSWRQSTRRTETGSPAATRQPTVPAPITAMRSPMRRASHRPLMASGVRGENRATWRHPFRQHTRTPARRTRLMRERDEGVPPCTSRGPRSTADAGAPHI
jgi:hypothetical protein